MDAAVAPGGDAAGIVAAALVGEVEGEAAALGLLDHEVALVGHAHGAAKDIGGGHQVALGRVVVADGFDEGLGVERGKCVPVHGTCLDSTP